VTEGKRVRVGKRVSVRHLEGRRVPTYDTHDLLALGTHATQRRARRGERKRCMPPVATQRVVIRVRQLCSVSHRTGDAVRDSRW
jgi:hypothetical protein